MERIPELNVSQQDLQAARDFARLVVEAGIDITVRDVMELVADGSLKPGASGEFALEYLRLIGEDDGQEKKVPNKNKGGSQTASIKHLF